MSPGDLVHLTETAHLSAGIDPSLDLFGVVLKSIDFREVIDEWREDKKSLTALKGSVTCYRVLLSNGYTEIFYEEDLERVGGNEKDDSS